MPGRSLDGAAASALMMLVVLGGCGGSSSNSSSSGSSTTSTAAHAADFNTAVSRAFGEFKLVSQATGATIQHASGQSDAELETEFKQLATRWQSAVNQLDALTPPASVIAPFDRLKPEVAKVETDLSAIVLATQTHDANQAKSATTSLVYDIVAAKGTATTISNKLGLKN